MRNGILYAIAICLCSHSIATSAQTNQSNVPTTLEGWAERAERFGKAIPQEQVFVHMDNNCYFLGDTIYYKAYVQRSDTRKPSKISGVLYADLYNQDGYLVERQLLELNNGQADGSFVLRDSLYSGFYELRAYTRWMLNWGMYEHPHSKQAEQWFINRGMAKDYYLDYDKLYSRTFPIYDKPKKEGEYTHDITLRPLRKRAKADTSAPKLDLKLYPEGGHMVADRPCRIAFEVNTEEGQHKEGNITVIDGSGKQVATAKTENRGRGTFLLTPEAEKTYTVQLTCGDQKTEIKLPKAETDGCAIQVSQAQGKINIEITSNGQASREPIGMTIMYQGQQQDFRQLQAGNKQTVTLEASSLPTGVNQITLFDAQGRIWADRLFFVRNGNTPIGNTITFSGLSKQGSVAYAPVEVKIKGGVPGSTLSVAVRDAMHSEYLFDNANIMAEMLLSSQIKGFVEDPNYFFEKDDEQHQRALDLLLMIQGWRRYDWHTMAIPGAFEITHQPERTPLFTGSVNRYNAEAREDVIATKTDIAMNNMMMTDGEREAQAADKSSKNNVAENANGDKIKDVASEMSKFAQESDNIFRRDDATKRQDVQGRFWSTARGPKRPVLVHAEFTKEGASGVTGEMMTKNSRFSIQSPRFFDGACFFLAASDTTKWNESQHKNFLWVNSGEDQKEELNYPEFYVKLDLFNPRFVKPYTWYQTHLAPTPQGSAINEDWQYDGSRTLKEVVVGAKRTSYTRFDASKPAFVVDAYDAFNAVSDAGLCYGIFTGGGSFSENVARYYIGDMNQERNYIMTRRYNSKTASANIPDSEKKKYDHLTQLDKVYIYTDYSPRQEGSKKYEASDQPEVIVDLRLLPNDMVRTTYRDRFYQLPGFSLCYEFYQPSYANKPLPEHKDYRRTLYWNPNVELDESGTATINFYNNGRQTPMGISAEGMADDGTLQSGSEMPENR